MQLAEKAPIACTLDGAMMAGRLSRIKALTDASLLSHDLGRPAASRVPPRGS
jgi:hypothetical protein